MNEIEDGHFTGNVQLPPELRALYRYVKELTSGIMPSGGPPAPFDCIDIPNGLIGDFIESVDDSIRLREKWTRMTGSTKNVILWRLPNGRVFRETFDSLGNLLRFEFVDGDER